MRGAGGGGRGQEAAERTVTRVRERSLLNRRCSRVKGSDRSWGMSTCSGAPMYAESPTANQRLSAGSASAPPPSSSGKMFIARSRSMSRATRDVRHMVMSCVLPTTGPKTDSRRPFAPVHTWNLRPWPLCRGVEGGVEGACVCVWNERGSKNDSPTRRREHALVMPVVVELLDVLGVANLPVAVVVCRCANESNGNKGRTGWNPHA